jgi:hypothetical protein
MPLDLEGDPVGELKFEGVECGAERLGFFGVGGEVGEESDNRIEAG